MGIKQSIAGMTERQKFWATVCLVPFAPVLMLAAIPVLIVLMILILMYEAAEDVIDQLWRWSSGLPQRHKPDRF